MSFFFLIFQYATPIVKQGQIDGEGELFDVQSLSYNEMCFGNLIYIELLCFQPIFSSSLKVLVDDLDFFFIALCSDK